MNQPRETSVLRFVINDSVEAALHSLTSAKAAKMDMSSSSAKGKQGAEPPLTLSDVATMLFDKKHVQVAA